MNARHLLSVSVLLAGTVAARGAYGVCMNAYTFNASVIGNSVIITPDNATRRVCTMSKPEALLRQNVATGQVVKLADVCTGEGWLDECIPRGGYRYGFGTPYTCCQTCCRTDFFVDVLIQQEPPANCEATRSPDMPKPAAYAAGVPWAGTKEICGFTPPPRPPSTPRPADAGPPGNPQQPTPGTTGTGGSAGPTNPGTVKGGCSVAGSESSAVILTLGGLLAAALFVRTSGRRRRH